MNEYSRIQNTKDRAALLAQFAQACATVYAAALNAGIDVADAGKDWDRVFEEIWKLIGPAEEEATE